MKLEKSETNNAIITKLCNVRPHFNADRLQLATVLGTQVIVGLDAKDGDLVVYFDSNLRLSHEYLYQNNLYSNKEMNLDPEVKGYFGKAGRVRAQRFRGEVSNGYVAELISLCNPVVYSQETVKDSLREGDEFTSIGGEEICSKYIVPSKHVQGQPRSPVSKMFHKHWDTKQLMREKHIIPQEIFCFFEEKVHGTSGRTGHVLCDIKKSWWKFWGPKEEWRVVSGTRRVDNINYHIPAIRQEVERRVAPHLYRGEEIYYEIYGYDENDKAIQTGYPYDCNLGEYKVVLYRVTITTLDGHVTDLNRRQVYKRAEELGLEKPYLLLAWQMSSEGVAGNAILYAKGKSAIDGGTLREGIVCWFENEFGEWKCLKHKSEEFLLQQDKNYERNIGDVEDEL